MSMFQLSGLSGGAPGCPCIDAKLDSILTCDENNSTLIKIPTLPEKSCFPKDYGSNCKQHDLSILPECLNSTEISVIPRWCHLKWCFIDADKCFSTEETFMESPLIKGAYASFTTCGNISKQWDPLNWEKNQDESLNFEAVFADYEYPFHFIEEENGTIVEYTKGETYNGNGVRKGVLIDYLEELKLRTNIKNINLNLPSGGSRKRFPQTSYTAAVNDVGAGIFDLGFGSFWTTPERLELTHFTIPFYESKIYLYEFDKEASVNDFERNIRQTLQPFSPALCGLLIIMLLLVGCVNVIVSNRRGDRAAWYEAVRKRDFDIYFKRRRFILITQVFLDSLMVTFIQCFGLAVTLDTSSTVGHKILMTGFGFFVLIMTASYTANLASFLTIGQLGNLIPSMDVAIQEKIKICAPAALKLSLLSKYQDDIFVFVDDLPQLKRSIEYMKNGTCRAVAADHTEMTTMIENVCELKVVSIKTLVMDIPISFPIQPQYASLFSKEMLKLEISGINFSKLVRPYEKKLSDCELYRTEKFTENSQLKILNLAFPMTTLFVCMILALSIRMSNGNRAELLKGYQKQTTGDYNFKNKSDHSKEACAKKDLDTEDGLLSGFHKQSEACAGKDSDTEDMVPVEMSKDKCSSEIDRLKEACAEKDLDTEDGLLSGFQKKTDACAGEDSDTEYEGSVERSEDKKLLEFKDRLDLLVRRLISVSEKIKVQTKESAPLLSKQD